MAGRALRQSHCRQADVIPAQVGRATARSGETQRAKPLTNPQFMHCVDPHVEAALLGVYLPLVEAAGPGDGRMPGSASSPPTEPGLLFQRLVGGGAWRWVGP